MTTPANIPVFILPWLIVPALNVKRALRLGIYFTFLLGTINIAVCLVRFIAIQQAGEDYSISLSTISTFSQRSPPAPILILCSPLELSRRQRRSRHRLPPLSPTILWLSRKFRISDRKHTNQINSRKTVGDRRQDARAPTYGTF